MKTKGFTHDEVAHLWASQSQDEGHGSRMFFVGDTIYSHGYHFPLARIIGDYVLMNADNYSVSTSQHKSIARRAVSHKRVIEVDYPEASGSDGLYRKHHAKNVKGLLCRLNEAIGKAERATKYTSTYLSEAESLRDDLREYLDLFKKVIDRRKKPFSDAAKIVREGLPIDDELQEKVEKQAEAEKERQRQRERRNREALQYLPAIVEAWRQGTAHWYNAVRDSNVPLMFQDFLSWPPKDYMRIEGDEIYTTKGARVSLEHARMLYRRLQNGKPVVGVHVGPYTVRSWNGEQLMIGCHTFDREEIEYIGQSQGWGEL